MPTIYGSAPDPPDTDSQSFPPGCRVRLIKSIWTPLRELPIGLLGKVVGSDPDSGKVTVEFD